MASRISSINSIPQKKHVKRTCHFPTINFRRQVSFQEAELFLFDIRLENFRHSFRNKNWAKKNIAGKPIPLADRRCRHRLCHVGTSCCQSKTEKRALRSWEKIFEKIPVESEIWSYPCRFRNLLITPQKPNELIPKIVILSYLFQTIILGPSILVFGSVVITSTFESERW